MVDFYIVRHGQTLLNSLDRAQGWADSPLTETGEQMAVDLGHRLESIAFDAAYASDMQRAVKTAELILSAGRNAAVPVKTDTRLREWCLGSMEAEKNLYFVKKVTDWLGAASFSELNERLPDVADAIYRHDTTGMAEPFSVIEGRLKDIFADIARIYGTQRNNNVLIVTHAFAIKTVFHLFAPEQLNRVGNIKNGAVSKLTFNGKVFFLEPDIFL